MAVRLVIADASPLIGLAAAEAFDLLRRLFGRVVVTEEVRDEVIAGAPLPGARELAAAIADEWITVVDVGGPGQHYPELGAGEASTIVAALEHDGPCLVLMDERSGRARAREAGLAVSGVAGILLAGRQAGYVERVRPYLERLELNGFRIASEVSEVVLADAGEG